MNNLFLFEFYKVCKYQLQDLENTENENTYRWGIANCIIMEYGFGFMLCITMALKTIEPCNYNLLNGSRLYSDYNSFFV